MSSTDADPIQLQVTAATDRFDQLYHLMLPRVHRFAEARLGENAAQDLVADVFHAVVVAFSDGREAQVTPAWIMAVTKNKVIDRWRTAERRSAITLRNRPRREELSEFPPDWHQDPRREEVLAALDAMSQNERALLVLHYLDGLTARSLSEAEGCSLRAMESRLSRARTSFRKLYPTTGDEA